MVNYSSGSNTAVGHVCVSSSGLGILHALSYLFLTKSQVGIISNAHLTDEVYY